MVSRDIFGGAEIGAKEGGDKVGRRIGRAMFPVEEGGGGRGYAGAAARSETRDERQGGRSGIAVTIQSLVMQFATPEGDNKAKSKSVAAEFAKLLEGALLELGAT